MGWEGAWHCSKARRGADHREGNSGNQHTPITLEVDGAAQPKLNRSLGGSSEQLGVQGQATRKSPVVHIMFGWLVGWLGFGPHHVLRYCHSLLTFKTVRFYIQNRNFSFSSNISVPGHAGLNGNNQQVWSKTVPFRQGPSLWFPKVPTVSHDSHLTSFTNWHHLLALVTWVCKSCLRQNETAVSKYPEVQSAQELWVSSIKNRTTV